VALKIQSEIVGPTVLELPMALKGNNETAEFMLLHLRGKAVILRHTSMGVANRRRRAVMEPRVCAGRP
jgi:hypothetical protein